MESENKKLGNDLKGKDEFINKLKEDHKKEVEILNSGSNEGKQMFDQLIAEKNQVIDKLTKELEIHKAQIENITMIKEKAEKDIVEKDKTIEKILEVHGKERESFTEQITNMENEKKKFEEIITEKEQIINKINEDRRKEIEALSLGTSQKLDQILEEKSSEISKLIKDMEDLKSNCESSKKILEAKLLEKDEIIKNYEKEIEDLKQQINKLEDTIKTLEQNIIEKDDAIGKQIEDSKKTTIEPAAGKKEEEIKKITQALSEKDKTIEKLIEMHTIENESFNEQITKLEELKTQNEQIIASKNKLIEDDKNEIEKLNKLLKSSGDNSNQAIAKLNDDNQKKLQKITQDYKVVEIAKQKSDQMIQEKIQNLTKLTNQYKELEKTNKKLEQNISKTETNYKKELANSEATKHKLEKAIAEHKKENDKLSHTITDSKKEIDKLTHQVSEQKKELDKLKKEHIDLQSTLSKSSGTDQQQKALMELVKKKDNEIAELKEAELLSITESKKQLAMMIEQNVVLEETHKGDVAQLNKTIEELSEKNKVLETQLLSQGSIAGKNISIDSLKELKSLITGFHNELIALSQSLQNNPSKSLIEKFLEQLKFVSTKIPSNNGNCANLNDHIKTIKELRYICKTFSNVEKEHINNYNNKLKKLQELTIIKNELSDPKIAKDSSKQKTVITKHLQNFPYLKTFNPKNDVKFLFPCMLKIAEIKLERNAKYQAELKNAESRFNIISKDVTVYEKKMADMQKT